MAWLPVTLNGHEFNPAVPDTMDWQLEVFDGFGGPGAIRASGPRVQTNGQWSTKGFKAGKAIGLSGSCYPAGLGSMWEQIAALEAAVSIDPVPLTVHWPDGDRTITVYRDGDLIIGPVNGRDFTWSCTVIADDPTWYSGGPPPVLPPPYPPVPSSDLRSLSTGLPATSGGLSFPFSFPFAFDATSVSGDVIFTTARGGFWFFMILGPVVNPRIITLQPDGAQRTLAWSLNMDAGEQLLVNPQDRSSKLGGTASRPPTIREWPRLLAGQTTVQFRADSGSGSLYVYYVPAA